MCRKEGDIINQQHGGWPHFSLHCTCSPRLRLCERHIECDAAQLHLFILDGRPVRLVPRAGLLGGVGRVVARALTRVLVAVVVARRILAALLPAGAAWAQRAGRQMSARAPGVAGMQGCGARRWVGAASGRHLLEWAALAPRRAAAAPPYRLCSPSCGPLPCTGSLMPGATASITSSATRCEEPGFCPVMSLPEATAAGARGSGAAVGRAWRWRQAASWQAAAPLMLRAALRSPPTCVRRPVGAHSVEAAQLLQLVPVGRMGLRGESGRRGGTPRQQCSSRSCPCSLPPCGPDRRRLPVAPRLPLSRTPALTPADRAQPSPCPQPPPQHC